MSSQCASITIKAKAAAAIASGKRISNGARQSAGGWGVAAISSPSPSKRSKTNNASNNEMNVGPISNRAAASIPSAKRSMEVTPKSMTSKVDNCREMNDPSTWAQNFYQLVLYQSRNNGSTIVSENEDELANWVRNERILYKKYTKGEVVLDEQQKQLQENHILAFKQIGFVFEASVTKTQKHDNWNNALAWQSNYDELVQYKNKHGVDSHPHTQSKLGRWVNLQRLAYREYNDLLVQFTQKYPNHPILLPEHMPRRNKTKEPKEDGMYQLITQDRIDKLNAIEGFQWDLAPRWTSFEARLEEYKQFQLEEGHGFVPQHYEKNRALGKWVSKTRYSYTLYSRGDHSQLTADKICQLKEIGFEFASKSQQA